MDSTNPTLSTDRPRFLAKSGAVAVSTATFMAAFAALSGVQDATPARTRSAPRETWRFSTGSTSRDGTPRTGTSLSEIHAEDVIVRGFGQATDGLPPHLAWAQEFRPANPGFFIEAHPIRIGVGEWTAVTGLFANGSTMATIARWENDQIAEEYLFFLDVG